MGIAINKSRTSSMTTEKSGLLVSFGFCTHFKSSVGVGGWQAVWWLNYILKRELLEPNRLQSRVPRLLQLLTAGYITTLSSQAHALGSKKILFLELQLITVYQSGDQKSHKWTFTSWLGSLRNWPPASGMNRSSWREDTPCAEQCHEVPGQASSCVRLLCCTCARKGIPSMKKNSTRKMLGFEVDTTPHPNLYIRTLNFYWSKAH